MKLKKRHMMYVIGKNENVYNKDEFSLESNRKRRQKRFEKTFEVS